MLEDDERCVCAVSSSPGPGSSSAFGGERGGENESVEVGIGWSSSGEARKDVVVICESVSRDSLRVRGVELVAGPSDDGDASEVPALGWRRCGCSTDELESSRQRSCVLAPACELSAPWPRTSRRALSSSHAGGRLSSSGGGAFLRAEPNGEPTTGAEAFSAGEEGTEDVRGGRTV